MKCLFWFSIKNLITNYAILYNWMFVYIHCNLWVAFTVYFVENLGDVGWQFGMPVITGPYGEWKISVPSYWSRTHSSGPMYGLQFFLFTVLVLTKHINVVSRHRPCTYYCGQFIYIFLNETGIQSSGQYMWDL